MSLKIPGTNMDFVVTPQYFLAEFDVYDREEDLGEELNRYNPNDSKDLRELFNRYLFSGKIVERYRVEHKAKIAEVLAETLREKDFDFGALIKKMYDSDEGFSLPSKWVFENPRSFFVGAYKAVYERWGKELKDSGVSIPEPSLFC